MKKRRLSDLYVVGKEITIDDGTGDPITVYLRKLNPVSQETALRKANAARARVLTSFRNKESEEYNALLSQAQDLQDRDTLIQFIISPQIARYQAAREAEIAAEEEWSEDNYLQGLMDSWNDEMRDRYAKDGDDPEAARVFKEFTRYLSQVEELVEAERKEMIKALEERPIEDLWDKAVEQMVSITGDSVWVKEFRKCEVWLSVYETDKKTRYFNDREEVDELPVEVLNTLIDGYRDIEVDPIQGKSSRGTDISSTSSEQPAPEEVSTPSGQADA